MTASPTNSLAWRAIAIIPVLFVCVVMLQVRIDAQQSGLTEQPELLIQSGPLLKKLSLGYNSLLADVYWTRAVQYYGAKLPTSDRNFSLLFPMLDVATTLDPNLIPAYHFGAFFLSEKQGGANRPDLAVELVKKGVAANPDNWQIASDLGFLYYMRVKDYEKASAAYLATSNIPGAPSLFKLLAARIASKGGAFETSRIIWSEVYETTQDPKVKEKALEELKGLKAQLDELKLDDVAAEYQKRFGRYPQSAKELQDAGMITGNPVDPDGFPYIFGVDGKSQLDPKSTIVIDPGAPTPR
ncbi:MAG: tetratricopeptide repeat protein [Candidatus Acidiferrales bacterium]